MVSLTDESLLIMVSPTVAVCLVKKSQNIFAKSLSDKIMILLYFSLYAWLYWTDLSDCSHILLYYSEDNVFLEIVSNLPTWRDTVVQLSAACALILFIPRSSRHQGYNYPLQTLMISAKTLISMQHAARADRKGWGVDILLCGSPKFKRHPCFQSSSFENNHFTYI